MKKYIIRRIFVGVAALLSTSVGSLVVTAHQWLTIKAPAIAAMVDPWTATTLAYALTTGALMMALSKWQGLPIVELQQWLTDQGLYAGPKSGLVGPETKAALAVAVNEDDIRMTNPPATKQLNSVIRPMGGKI